MLPPGQSIAIVDIGCGQGTTVQTLHALGYANASGVDISSEQVDLARRAGIPNVHCSDFFSFLEEHAGVFDVVLATDVLEHCTKTEVLDLFDAVRKALRPGGVFVARVPNAGSPFVGRIQFGDFTHETSFTVGSLAQISKVTGFSTTSFLDPGPVPHGVRSAIRLALWKVISCALKVILIAETGQTRGHYVAQTVIMRAVR